MSRLTHAVLLASLASLLGGSAFAQEELSPVGPDPAIYVTPASRIVVKVARYCRGRVCVRVLEVKEVVDDLRLHRAAPEGREQAQIAAVPYANSPSIAERPSRANFAPPLPVAPVEANDPLPLAQVPQTQAPQALPLAAAAPTCGSADETAAWRALNRYRAENGLTPVACDALALKVGRGHSRDMCQRGYFSHYAPEGTAPWDRLRAAGGRFRQAGENIAVGYDTPQGAHDGWVASDGHRNNMLNPAWTRAAVGLVDCNGDRYWTQMFAR